MASQATLDRLCAEFDSPAEHITAAVKLLEENATPAFLSRYRRYETGNLNEDRLVAVAERLHALTELEQRRATILEQAEERGRRTPELGPWTAPAQRVGGGSLAAGPRGARYRRGDAALARHPLPARGLGR